MVAWWLILIVPASTAFTFAVAWLLWKAFLISGWK